MNKRPILILCGGTQSSGSTLISWCFLQRGDTNGMLDANGDMIFSPVHVPASAYYWYKTTISCFRLSEHMACARDEGFEVRPLLIVRDIRDVWASLRGKPYGLNGTTAEDPPLRLRMRRFLEDWRLFREKGWPILKFEAFLEDPRGMLEQTCLALQIPWDEAMISWPKPPQAIQNAHHGNATFRMHRAGGLMQSLKRDQGSRPPGPVSSEDLAWLEESFEEFHRVHGYPQHRDMPADGTGRMVPSFDVTRRVRWRIRQKPVRWLLWKLGLGKPSHLPGNLR